MNQFKQDNPRPITLDQLAQMVAQGFAELGERMATRTDLAETASKADLAEGLYALREELRAKFAGVHSRLDDIIIQHGRRIGDLEEELFGERRG